MKPQAFAHISLGFADLGVYTVRLHIDEPRGKLGQQSFKPQLILASPGDLRFALPGHGRRRRPRSPIFRLGQCAFHPFSA
jgi:hypothetical protein